jgi:hypothetical protein
MRLSLVADWTYSSRTDSEVAQQAQENRLQNVFGVFGPTRYC